MSEVTHMTALHMREFLGTGACNAYVRAHFDNNTELVEIGIQAAADWLDGRDADEVLEGAIIHGGTALRIGG